MYVANPDIIPREPVSVSAFPLGERSRGGIDETSAFPSCMRIREVGHVRRCEESIS
jgi:hypothetical protein